MSRKNPDDNAETTQNEGVFQQLLSAAYVVQQHNDQAKSSPPDPSEFRAADLSEIAETQNLIRNKQLDLISAANVIVTKAMKISNADGGAIALASKNELSYIASDGVAARSAGTGIPLDQSLSAECIRTGKFLALADLRNAPRPQADFFRSQAVQSFASVPVRQDQIIAGVLELYFLKSNAISESSLRTCQLLARLLTGTVTSKPEAIAAPTRAELSPLDQLKSQLDRMVEEDAVPDLVRSSFIQQDSSKPEMAKPNLPLPSLEIAAFAEKEITRCRKCGCPLEASESFCGLCGTSRNAAVESSKVAKLPASPEIMAAKLESVSAPTEMAKEVLPAEIGVSLNSKADLPKKSEELPAELKEILNRFPEEQETQGLAAFASTPKDLLLSTSVAPPQTTVSVPPNETKLIPTLPEKKPVQTKGVEVKATEIAKSDTALSAAEASENNPQWHSASETKAWLESKKSPGSAKHWLLEYRANLYLAAAILLLVLVLLGVGIPNNNGPKQLGWFDSMLVSLGVAEAPASTTYAGNPSTKVWVDTHTALYYCPGSDSYGKTHGGKFETQREAQDDQFEPATRQACP